MPKVNAFRQKVKLSKRLDSACSFIHTLKKVNFKVLALHSVKQFFFVFFEEEVSA